MAINDIFHRDIHLSSGEFMTVDASGSGTGQVEIQEMGGSNSATIYRSSDSDGDDAYRNFTIDQASGSWHSQGNALTCSGTMNLMIENTSDSGAEYFVVGIEVGSQ